MTYLIIFGAKYLFLVSILITLYIFLRLEKTERLEMFKLGAILLPITYIVGLLARRLYENPRPFVIENIAPLVDHAADNGFPSDHVLLLTSLATLSLFFNRKISIILWVITLLVGISRVLANVHHTLDIIGSIIISIMCGGVIYFIHNHKTNATNHDDK